jgi:hypothetical protein
MDRRTAIKAAVAGVAGAYGLNAVDSVPPYRVVKVTAEIKAADVKRICDYIRQMEAGSMTANEVRRRSG